MSFERIIDAGYRPYISTNSFLKSSLNLKPFGLTATTFQENEKDFSFHNAYLIANTLAFGDIKSGLGMPQWVMTDYVLNQTAIIGFMAPRSICDPQFLANLGEGENTLNVSNGSLKIEDLEYLPVSGQIAGLCADGETWFGSSLFSHQPRSEIDGLDFRISAYTKALALEVYQAKRFRGLTQYRNKAVSIHGIFGELGIDQAIVWTHSRPFESFTYSMKVDFDPNQILVEKSDEEFDFYLDWNDNAAKQNLQARIKSGEKFKISYPYRDSENSRTPIKQVG